MVIRLGDAVIVIGGAATIWSRLISSFVLPAPAGLCNAFLGFGSFLVTVLELVLLRRQLLNNQIHYSNKIIIKDTIYKTRLLLKSAQ